jgi:hypothetical protein
MRGQSPRPGVVLASAVARRVLNSGRARLSGTVPVGTGPGVCCCWTLGIAIIVATDKIEITVTFRLGLPVQRVLSRRPVLRGQSPQPGGVLASAVACRVLNSGHAWPSGTVPVGTGPGVCCCRTPAIALIAAADKIEIIVTFRPGPPFKGFCPRDTCGLVPAADHTSGLRAAKA